MDRQPVESSNLRSIGYDPQSSILEIEFNSGEIWDYPDFPCNLFEDFLGADSKGKFFHKFVRGQYHEYRVG
jgi:hypothetical protein